MPIVPGLFDEEKKNQKSLVVPNLFPEEDKKSRVVPNLFPEENNSVSVSNPPLSTNNITGSRVIPNLFPDEKTGSRVVPNLFPEDKPRSFFGQMKDTLIQEGKTFGAGASKAMANSYDTLDFYSDKIANVLGMPQTKSSIFEYLRNNWQTLGDRLQKGGLSKGIMSDIVSGLGEAAVEVPKLMIGGSALKLATLPAVGAAEGFKTGGGKGALEGGVQGAGMQTALGGLARLPFVAKIPAAFLTGAVTTPGGVQEKVAGGAVLAGLSVPGKSPSMQEFKKTVKPLLDNTAEKRESTYQNLFNRFQSIENVAQKAKEAGMQVKPGEDPGIKARSYLGIGGKVDSVLNDKTYTTTPEGKFTITGEGLKPILDDFDVKISPLETNSKIREQDLNEYLISQRTIKDLQRPKFEGSTENIVSPEQVKASQAKITALQAKYGQNTPILEATAQRLYEYQKRVLHSLVDSGNMSEETFQGILAQNQNYVPFDRVIEGFEPSGVSPVNKNRFTGARSPVKKIKGSELEIHNPMESMVKNTYRIMDIADRNSVARSVAKLSAVLPDDISPVRVTMRPVTLTESEVSKMNQGATPGGDLTSQERTVFRPSQFKPKGNVIEYFDEGQRKYMEVTPNLHQAMTGLNESSSTLFTKIMSLPATALRRGATLTPEFIARNPIRDQWTAMIQTNFGFKPFLDPAAALGDLAGKSQAYYDWLRSGGAQSGFSELSRKNLAKRLEVLKENPTIMRGLKIYLNPAELSQLTEQATRMGVYKAGVRSGLSPLEAGFQSREATLDFARRGAQMGDVNKMIAFFNANVQAFDKNIRTAVEDPAGLAMKGVATITIPSVLLYLKNRDDPGYYEIPRWQRDMFWITKVKNTYVRIPKPFSYGQVFGSIPERFMEYLDKNDPAAFNKLGKSVYDALSPISGDVATGMLSTAFKPLIENQTNWSFFKQAPLVSEGKKRLLPSYQSDKYTSETAKLIGKQINVSPIKVENIIQGWSGGTGRYALEGGDLILRTVDKLSGKATPPERPAELSDIPLIKGFVARSPYTSAESINQFYQMKKEANQAYATFNKFIDEGNIPEARKILQKYPYSRFSEVMDDYSGMLSDYGEMIDNVIKSDVSIAEKRSKIDDIEKKRVGMIKKGFELMGKSLERVKSEQKKSRVVPNLFPNG